jgi:hypothetical protein
MSRTALSEEARLRSDLKAAGFNARKVSVRRSRDSLYITIRDASVALSVVRPIAETYRNVHRDERSGEILCGGNTFVDVEYLDSLIAPVAARIVALLAPADDGRVVGLPGGFRAAKISRARGATMPDEVAIWGPGFDVINSCCCGVAFAAKRIAIAYLDAVATGAVIPDALPASEVVA